MYIVHVLYVSRCLIMILLQYSTRTCNSHSFTCTVPSNTAAIVGGVFGALTGALIIAAVIVLIFLFFVGSRVTLINTHNVHVYMYTLPSLV